MLEPDVERMAHPPVRPGRGHLAVLLEVTGGPDAQALADARDGEPAAPAWPRRAGQHERRRRPRRSPSAHAAARQERQRPVPCEPRSATLRRGRTTAAHHLVERDVVDARRGTAALALVEALARARSARPPRRRRSTARCARRWSDRRARRRACRRRRRCAAGRCRRRPRCRAALAMPKRSDDATSAAPARRRRSTPRPRLLRALSLARAPQHQRRPAEALANGGRQRAEAIGRPALVGPRRAGIDQREAGAPPKRASTSCAGRRARHVQRKRGLAGLDRPAPPRARGSCRRRAPRRRSRACRCRTRAPPARAGAPAETRAPARRRPGARARPT